MLSRIELTNFKQHKHLEVDFATGLTLVTGPNYSGKSNLVKAIAFALGGVSMIPGQSDAVPTRGTKKGSCKVKLDLSIDDAVWQIERGLSNVKLRKNGEVVATGNAAVNEKVEELLGVDRKIFNLIKYVKQGDTQALLTLGSGKLHSLLEALSGADFINRAVGALSDHVKHLDGKLDGFGNEPENYAQIVEWKKEYDTKLIDWHQQIEAMEQQVSNADSVYNEKEQEFHRLAAYNNEQRRLAAQEAAYKSNKEYLEGQLAAIDKALADLVVEDTAALLSELTEIRDRRTRARDLQRTLDLANQAVKDTSEELEVLTKAKVALEAKLKGYKVKKGDIDKAENVFNEASLAFASGQERIKHLQEAIRGAVCPTCKRPFEDHDPEALEAELSEARGNLTELTEAVTEAKSYLEKLRAEFYSQERDKGELNRMVSTERQEVERLEHLKGQVESFSKSLGSISVDSQEAEEQLNLRYEIAAQAKGRQNQMLSDRSRLAKTLSDLTAPPQPEPLMVDEEYAAMEALETLREEWTALSSNLSRWKEHYASEYGKWSHWKQVIQQEEGRKAKIEQTDKERSTAQKLLRFLRSNRDRFMSELWTSVTTMASEFTRACTGGAVEGLRRTDDGSFTFVEEGVDVPVVEASGAQRSIMSTGLLVALNKLVPGSFGALILDEPGADMDDAHSAALTQALAASGTQLVMISHRNLEGSLAGAHVHLG